MPIRPTLESDLKRFFAMCDRTGQCWLWRGAKKENGYGVMALRGRGVYAHRAAWMLFVGPIASGMCVCHKCDTPPCVNPAHLFLGTTRENSLDMVAKERAPKTKLNITDVREIRRRRNAGETCVSLAAVYGVSFATISHVARRRTWKPIA